MLQNITTVISGKMFVNKYDELKTLDSGTDIFTFTIAIPNGKDDDGNYQNEYVKISVFGGGAKFISENHHRIDSVYVVGTPRVEVWNDKEGNAKGKLNISTNSVSVIAWKKSDNSESDVPDTTPKKSNDPFA